ncbi:MAG: aspartate aminotransferase family protein [Gemmatimonadota bacterium]|nr:aspartate aminotransferase family protein [Gemmatimonadota bacterium]
MTDTKKIIRDEAKYILGTYLRPDFVLEKGQGCYLFDTGGKRYLDLVSGIGVNALGYGDKRLGRVIAEQAGRLIHCSNLYHTGPDVRLARMLVKSSFADKVFFCNSGAEAVEGAMKLARKWALKKFGPQKSAFVAFTGSFHGRTFGALALTDRKKYRMPFEPLVPGARFAEFGNLKDLERKIGPETCAVVVEPVQGEGGIHPSAKGFLADLKKLCRERDALLIYDEVQCGLGRTGRLFAYEHFGVEPDILCLAKPLAGGLPMGAVLASDRVAECIDPGDHATTFGGGLLVSAAAVEVLGRLKRPAFLKAVRHKGEYLLDGLNGLKTRFPDKVVEARGLGLMAGVELSFSAGTLLEKFFERGFLVCTAGERVVRVLPPLIITKRQIDSFIRAFGDILVNC